MAYKFLLTLFKLMVGEIIMLFCSGVLMKNMKKISYIKDNLGWYGVGWLRTSMFLL